MIVEMVSELKAFFHPESVAVVGASKTPGKAGHTVIANMLRMRYEGRIYPINPNADQVLGFKAYRTLKEIPGKVELAVIVVPAQVVVDVMRDCAEKGIRAAVIGSGGFSEVNERGAKLQNEIVKISGEAGIKVVGPNTSGIISTPGNFTTTFFPQEKVRRGYASYVAQTGNFATHTMRWITTAEYFGVSRVIGLGNKCDVDDADAIEYLADDPETKVIAMYIEGLKNARKFLEVARKVTKRKPIIALKSGRTAAGAQAAMSHTASLAGNDVVVDAALRQAGVIRATKYMDLVNFTKAFCLQPLPKGNRVALVMPSGAMGVITADACESLGLKVAKLSKSTLQRLTDISPRWIRMSNPVDIWAAAQIQGVEKAYKLGMEALLEDQNVDAVIATLMLVEGYSTMDLKFIPEINKYIDKPILITVTGDKQLYEVAKRELETRGVPVYLPLEPACEALAAMANYTRYRSRGCNSQSHRSL